VDFREYDTRLAAYAVIVDDRDRVLLALWNERDEPAWTLPGGGVELHESPEQGAVREVREESGYDVELTGLLGIDSHVVPPEERLHWHDKPLKSVRVLYSARVIGGSLTAELDGTTDEARWIPLADVPTLPRVSLVDAAMAAWRSAAVSPR
jgi:8-oxo-dGTP diphosphatase